MYKLSFRFTLFFQSCKFFLHFYIFPSISFFLFFFFSPPTLSFSFFVQNIFLQNIFMSYFQYTPRFNQLFYLLIFGAVFPNTFTPCFFLPSFPTPSSPLLPYLSLSPPSLPLRLRSAIFPEHQVLNHKPQYFPSIFSLIRLFISFLSSYPLTSYRFRPPPPFLYSPL